MVPENESAETSRLLQRAQSGDKNALDALFADHRNYLRRVVELRMVDDLRRRMDPSDVIQETQLAAAKRVPEYLADRRVSFRIWIRQTAIQQLVDLERRHVKAQRRTLKRETRLPNHSSVMLAHTLMDGRPSQVLHRRELVEQIRETVDSMSETDTEILLLRHFEGLTNHEISEVLGISPDAVSRRHGRAILRLRAKLKDKGITESI